MKLTEKQYLKWALAVERLLHAKCRTKLAEKTLQVANYDIQIAQYNARSKKSELEVTMGKEKLVDADWLEVRKSLEKELNIEDLSQYGVNEDTLELEHLPTEGK